MRIPPLFHWSPVSRRDAIRAHGLQPFSRATVCSDPGLTLPYISLSSTPSQAWGLSGDMDWVSEIEEWDLWQVNIPDKAETHIRPLWGDWIEEIKVFTVIPPHNIWHVATRTVPVMEPVK